MPHSGSMTKPLTLHSICNKKPEHEFMVQQQTVPALAVTDSWLHSEVDDAEVIDSFARIGRSRQRFVMSSSLHKDPRFPNVFESKTHTSYGFQRTGYERQFHCTHYELLESWVTETLSMALMGIGTVSRQLNPPPPASATSYMLQTMDNQGSKTSLVRQNKSLDTIKIEHRRTLYLQSTRNTETDLIIT